MNKYKNTELLKVVLESKLTSQQRNIILSINYYRNYETGVAFPAVKTIAKRANMSLPTVYRTLEELKELGVLIVNKLEGHTNSYRIDVQKLNSIADVESLDDR